MRPKLLMTASSFGHIASFHLPYIKGFHDLGWEVHVACGGASRDIPFAEQTIELPFRKQMFSPDNLKASFLLHRLIRENHYDLLITHTSLAAFFSRLALLGLNKEPRTVNVVHGYLFDEKTSKLKTLLLKSAELLVAGKTDLVLTMNEYDFRWAATHVAGKVVHYIPGMGVSLPELCDSEELELNFAPEDFILIFPAEFSDRKNQTMLIEAMPQLPERVKLILPGTGERLGKCEELAKSLGVSERVVFPGYVNNIPALLRKANVAVSSSRIEGLPFNVLEAMSSSLPVIVSRIKGNSDLVEEGITGLLYEYGDMDGYIKAVHALLDSSSLCVKMGMEGKKKSTNYSLGLVYPQVMKEYIG